jgi:hypothetical protein
LQVLSLKYPAISPKFWTDNHLKKTAVVE